MKNYAINIDGCINILNDASTAAKHLTEMLKDDAVTLNEKLKILNRHIIKIVTMKELARFSEFWFKHNSSENVKSLATRLASKNKSDMAVNLLNNIGLSREADTLREEIFKLNKNKDLDKKRLERLNQIDELFLADQSGIRRYLSDDLQVLKRHSDLPISRRIDATNFSWFLTKSYGTKIYGDVLEVGKLRCGKSYRLMHWADLRAKYILTRSLGETVSLGVIDNAVEGIGSFIPTSSPELDLKTVQYFNKEGRWYYPSAFELLSGENNSEIESHRFTSSILGDFGEVIPTPAQAKAIYSPGNIIIDGPAGTGKTTSILQKVRIECAQNGVRADRVLVVAKHDGVKRQFLKLLEENRVNDVRVVSFKEANNERTSAFLNCDTALIAKLKSSAKRLVDEVASIRGELSDFSRDNVTETSPTVYKRDDIFGLKTLRAIDLSDELIRSIEDTRLEHTEWIRLRNMLASRRNHLRQEHLKQQVKEALESVVLKRTEISTTVARGNLVDTLVLSRWSLTLTPADKDRSKELDARLFSINTNYGSNPDAVAIEKQLAHDAIDFLVDVSDSQEEAMLKLLFNNFRFEDSLDHVTKNIDQKVKEDLNELDTTTTEQKEKHNKAFKDSEDVLREFEKQLYSLSNLKAFAGDSERAWVISTYIDKLIDPSLLNFDLMIIDEAQDLDARMIEALAQRARCLMLSGDEAQSENADGLHRWANLITPEFFKDDRLEIHSLKVNFRQSYELGAFNHNFRQALLNRDFEDIRSEYFDNQAGYPHPELKAVSSTSELLDVINELIKFAKESLDEIVPVTVIYGSLGERDALLGALKGLKVESETNRLDSFDYVPDVILVSSSEVAGRSFPVVCFRLESSLPLATTYIRTSRATVKLVMFCDDICVLPPPIVNLHSEGLLNICGY
ncbi:UvrD-helicase domain-containing protein [Umboniibacter marinipuniceus]|uniref:UvrD/REP helicase N-terminal domain-containing protein n=1 Tax=Umboniibacter marinipuniceus TaxID=569599 RepID=A0A3M0ACL2_9GAMM|nr:UvrD-helicase domain-containing protein [Umboniibacter marinipuniceus]RMA82680.1 UvrD/REP helicase N-terminal domain-containing protein [Umboniibacter marinipuniceus]